jgi:hypothetical protein
MRVAKRLRLRDLGSVRLEYPDGVARLRSKVRAVLVKLLGRKGVYSAVVADVPTAVIGRIVLDDLDLVIRDESLRRRNPRYITAEY